MVKTAVFGVLVFLAIAFLAVSVTARIDWSVSWEKECGGCCIKNHNVNFTVEVDNTGSENFTLNSVRIDLKNGTTIATWGRADRRWKTIEPGNNRSVIATGKLPAFGNSASAYYRTCIYITYNSTIWGFFSNWTCSSDFLSMTLVNSSVHACDSDSNCSANQHCSIDDCESECVNLTAGSSCGNFTNHQWVSYGCCSNSTCAQSQACINHRCTNVSCPCGELSNHVCTRYECCNDTVCGSGRFCTQNHTCNTIECQTDNDCPPDKICSGRECNAIQCTGCAYAAEHTCKNYECCSNNDCANTQTCENHVCTELSCEPLGYPNSHVCVMYECISNDKCTVNQSCQNHECKSVECSEDKKVSNHACVPLDCSPIEYTKEHRCVSYLSMEGIGDNPLPLIALVTLIIVVISIAWEKKWKKTKTVEPKTEVRNKKGRKIHKKGAAEPPEDRIVALAEKTVEETKEEKGEQKQVDTNPASGSAEDKKT